MRRRRRPTTLSLPAPHFPSGSGSYPLPALRMMMTAAKTKMMSFLRRRRMFLLSSGLLAQSRHILRSLINSDRLEKRESRRMSELDGRKGGRCLRPKRRPRSVVNSFINKSSYVTVRCPGRQIKRIVAAAPALFWPNWSRPFLSSSVLVLMLSFVRCFRVSPSALSLAFSPRECFRALCVARSLGRFFVVQTLSNNYIQRTNTAFLFCAFCNSSHFGLTSFQFFAITCDRP